MYKALLVAITLFCSVASASIISHAQELTPDPKPESTNKMMPIMLECDSEPKKLFDLVTNSQYAEQPFAAGKVIIRSAVTGGFANVQAYMLVNSVSRSFSIIGVFEDGSACLLLNGNSFAPYIPQKSL